MQSAIRKKFQELLEIKQVSVPQAGPDDVLVKLIQCGVCRTDLHFVRGGEEMKSLSSSSRGTSFFILHFPVCEPHLPRMLGHEGIGEVV